MRSDQERDYVMKKELSVTRALPVEMAGVEPASEERTTRPTTYVVHLSNFTSPHPKDRTIGETTPRGLFPGSENALEESISLACQKSAPLRDPADRIPGDGLLS